MNGQDPRVKLSLKELQEILAWRGRDSRLVRAAMKWSRWKKNALCQLKYRLSRRRKNAPSQLQILFWLPGGLGDAACAKRLVSAYRSCLPDAQFDIYAPLPGVAQMLFGADKHTHILESSKFSPLDYDLAVQACMAVKFLHADEARLERFAPSFIPVWEKALQAQQSLGTLLDDLFLTDGLLGRWLYARGGRRFDLLAYTGGMELPHNSEEKLPVSLEP